MATHQHHRHGFTLVELSIVMVIIGLLIGGVLAGQEMILTSELNSIGVDVQKFQTAANTFQDKYNAKPGDMKNASFYWPTKCLDLDMYNRCNGDGNRIIGAGSPARWEAWRFFQHLGFAGLIAGDYTIQNTLGEGSINLDENAGIAMPASRFNGAHYSLHPDNLPINYRINNYALVLGRYDFDNGFNVGAFIKPRDAYSIDKKLDDGVAYKGWVQGHGGFDSNGDQTGDKCTDGSQGSGMYVDEDYLMTGKERGCVLWFAS